MVDNGGGQISEYVVSVSAVLETTGVDQTARQRVMGVVGRLVDRLARAEEEKDSATMQLKGEEKKKEDKMVKNCFRDGSEVHTAGEGAGGEERGQAGGRRGGGRRRQWPGELSPTC